MYQCVNQFAMGGTAIGKEINLREINIAQRTKKGNCKSMNEVWLSRHTH